MTAIPFQTHAMIRQAIAPVFAPMRAAFQGQSYRTKLSYHAAKLALDFQPSVWYYKGTSVEIVYARSMGFVLLDHVLKQRSPALNNLLDALRARENTLKEHENARTHASVEAEASGSDAASADRDQASV